MEKDEKEKTITSPAARTALMKGDLENFCVASTPGGIEAQEKAGQETLVSSAILPKEYLNLTQEDLEKVGFVFGKEIDELFIEATLPLGWKKVSTGHDMWSEIIDENGKTRFSIFYKAAFYDRRAFMCSG